MRIDVLHQCSEFDGYRAARVKSLFNAETGSDVAIRADLPIENNRWRIGAVVGPSGSGKSTIGREIFGPSALWEGGTWPTDAPIVEAIAPAQPFDRVTAALAAVGLGSVPTWLRPYSALSNGERFRAGLARLLCEAPARAVVDEYSSVVDRQIARLGSLAFGRAWRRTSGRLVILSCNLDVLDWLEPDWVFDTGTGRFNGAPTWHRPTIALEVRETDASAWPQFEPHHYLRLPKLIAATHYVGMVEGEAIAHVAVTTRPGLVEARAARLVVLPQWQGVGIGRRFLNAVCARWLGGDNHTGRRLATLINTSHPGLCAALRRDPAWTQVSASLYGNDKTRSGASMAQSVARGSVCSTTGYGGHFRAVQGFRYWGI